MIGTVRLRKGVHTTQKYTGRQAEGNPPSNKGTYGTHELQTGATPMSNQHTHALPW